MAFVRKNLTKIGGGNGGNAFYHYTTTDNLGSGSGEVSGAGYFNDAADFLQVNDILYIIDTNDTDADGSKLCHVKSNNGTTVVITAGELLSNA